MLKLHSKLLCFCLTALLAVLPASLAQALTWQLEQIQGRERLTITLDAPVPADQANPIERNSTHSVGLGLSTLPEQIEALSASGNLVNGLSLDNGQVRVDTGTAAFGFVSSRPDANTIVLDFYPDPLGERWQPSGGLASPPATPAQPALPEPEPEQEQEILFEPEIVTAEPIPQIVEESLELPPNPESEPSPLLPEQNLLEPEPEPALASESLGSLASEPLSEPEPFPATPAESEPDNLSGLPPFDGPAAQAPLPPEALLQGPPLAPADLVTSDQSPAIEPEPALPKPDDSEPVMQDDQLVAPAETSPLNNSDSNPASIPDSSSDTGQAVSPTSQAMQNRMQAPYRPGLSGSAPVEVHLAAPTGQDKGNGTIVLMGINPGGPQDWPEEQGVNFSPTGALPQTGVLPLGESAAEGAVATAVEPLPASLPGSAQQIPPAPAFESEPAPLTDFIPPSYEPAAVEPAPELTPDLPSESAPALAPELSSELSPDLPETEVPAENPAGNLAEDLANQAIPPAPAEPEAEPASAHAPESAEPELEPIYMDEEGNIIPKPRDIPADIQQARDLMLQSRYEEAQPLILSLLEEDLDLQTREDLLYYNLEILFERGKPKFENNAAEVIQAANAAMNFNQNSLQIPRALTALALVNLAEDNIAEATAYMNLLRTRNPMHPNVAANFLALGQKLVERHDFAEASAALEIIVQDYPDNPEASEAARLQTYALFNQGRYDRALAMLEFVERRWPRLYINDHDFLSMAAEIRVREGRLPDAISTFWMQYNLDPGKPESATILQRIAELYFQLGDNAAAINVLERLTTDFPTSPEMPLALLRIGENGVFDPRLALDEILHIFEQPNPRLPSLYYGRIIQDFPGTPEAATAELRTLAWLLWNREYAQALTGAGKFSLDHLERPEAQIAVEIMLRAFAWELGLAINEQNYERVATLWESYPHLQQYYEPLEPDVRLALGRAYLNRGDEARAFEILRPFLADGGDPNYGFYAYTVFLTSLLNQQDWSGVLELGETVANWNLPLDAQLQLDYAMALSAENLGLQGRSLPLWQKLAGREDIPLYQRAYANYFMARDAERRQDLREAYQFNLDTLGMFVELRDQQSPYADNERIRESIAALMDVTEIAGRYAEALEWANQYAAFVPPNSPDYAGLRLREARLHKKMGDNLRWRSILQSIVDSEPDSVFGQMAAAELRTEDMARDLSRFTQ